MPPNPLLAIHPYALAITAAFALVRTLENAAQAAQNAERQRRLAEEAERRARRALEALEAMQRRLEDTIAQRDDAEHQARLAEQARKDALHQKAEAEKAQRNAEQARKDAEERLLAGIPPEVRPTHEDKMRFREKYNIDPSRVNIAVVGTSGAGKSSFLNSVRGLSPRGQDAAKSGFNETTQDVQGYPDPDITTITWYDVPGANTPRISGWRYFVEQGLYVFDVLVVVFADRFTQTAGTLIGNANKCHIPVFLVRTKSDQLIYNAISDSGDAIGWEEAKEVVVGETRQMVQDNLVRLELPNQRVYIVSREGMRRLVADQDDSGIIDEQQFLDDIMPYE